MSYIGSTPTTQSFIAGTDYFNGDGTTVNFTMSRAVNSVNDIEVIVNNVEQIPSGYSVSGTTLTFSAAPSAGTSNVYVRYLSTTLLSVAPTQGSSMQFGIGSAALPSISFTGDTNTGIFSPAADTIAFAEGGVEAMRITSTGDVGIGTASPSLRLHVSGSSTYVAGVEGSSTFALMGFKASGTTGTMADPNVAIGATGDALYLRAGGAERARIDSSGNLLVGTTAVPNVGLTGQFGFSVSSSEVVISKSGADGLIIRTTSAASNNIRLYNLNNQVGSVSTTTSATAYNTSSDYRLKNTIAPMTGALAKVALLKPVTYKWNVDGSNGQGFIAHELQEVVEGCVTGEKDAVDADGNPQYQGIDTSFLVATLTAAIQEQQALITALTTRITALENNNATQ